MYLSKIVLIIFIIVGLDAGTIFAQGIGEYGRTVGSVPNGKTITGPKLPGSGSQGGKAGAGATLGAVNAQPLPTRLVVITPVATLYPRQDDETEAVSQLNQGEPLIPMVQAVGGSEWYMVKTQGGLVGWVKSIDVRQESVKK